MKATTEMLFFLNRQWHWQIVRYAVLSGKRPVVLLIVWCPTPMPAHLVSALITICSVATRRGRISSSERKLNGANNFFVNNEDAGSWLAGDGCHPAIHSITFQVCSMDCWVRIVVIPPVPLN